MKTLNITRLAIAASATGVLAVAAIGFASNAKSTHTQSAAAAITDPATLQKFEHARVVNATPAELAAIARSTDKAAYAAAQRAYVDADTRQLRPATPEELAAQGAAPAPAAQAPQQTLMDNGAIRVALDESSMVYSVAKVGPDGSVKQDCVENQPSEQAALNVAAASSGADSHEK